MLGAPFDQLPGPYVLLTMEYRGRKSYWGFFFLKFLMELPQW